MPQARRPSVKSAVVRAGSPVPGGGNSEPADGRAARSHRTRLAIVDAMRALHAEGDLSQRATRDVLVTSVAALLGASAADAADTAGAPDVDVT
ncbi:hypothetical protein ACQB60_23035 [Actinomycetota bacterium Odt1-20B]